MDRETPTTPSKDEVGNSLHHHSDSGASFTDMHSMTEKTLSPSMLKKFESWDDASEDQRRASRNIRDGESDDRSISPVGGVQDLPPGVFFSKAPVSEVHNDADDMELEELPSIGEVTVDTPSPRSSLFGSSGSAPSVQTRKMSTRDQIAERWRNTERELSISLRKMSLESIKNDQSDTASKNSSSSSNPGRRSSVGAIEDAPHDASINSLRRTYSSGASPKIAPKTHSSETVTSLSKGESGVAASPSRRLSASGRRYSFNNGVRRLSQNLKQMFSGKRRYSGNMETHPGKVFWLHHGECNNDEKKTLTGVIDTSLTEFGKHQAAKAGQDVARTIEASGVKISAVYSSYMLRALETVKCVIQQKGVVTPETQFYVRGDLAGRSFGVFTNASTNLLRSALGYDIFENLLHSSDASPLGGEGIMSIHRRCERFYKKHIIPHLIMGENVLVVTHSCNLNVMAYVLAKKSISSYKAFEIPHGKVIESEDLINLMDRETSAGIGSVIMLLETYLTFMVAELSASAFVAGIAMRLVLDLEMQESFYYSCLIAFLATSSFYALLNVNIRTAFWKVPRYVWVAVGASFTLRWVVASPLLWYVASEWDTADDMSTSSSVFDNSISGGDNVTTAAPNDMSAATSSNPSVVLFARWTLWWILPPALNTTSLSMWTGGDLYPSAAISTIMSIVIPPLVVLLCYLLPGAGLVEVEKLNYFYYIMVGGFVLPSFASQVLRNYSPVGSKKHGNRWQLLGGFSHIGTVFITGWYLTPAETASHVRCICSFGCDSHDVAGIILVPLFTALLIAVAVRLFGAVVYTLVNRMSSRIAIDRQQIMDIYLLLTNPNFFMWIAVLIAIEGETEQMLDEYTLFFGGFFYFLSFPIERRLVVKRFTSNLIQQSVSNMRMPKSEIQELWDQVKHPDREFLTVDDLSYAIWIICKQTQGWIPGTAKLTLLAQKLMTVMTRNTVSDKKDIARVTYDEFSTYFAWHGKKLDFNTTTDGENDQNYAFDVGGNDGNDQATFLKKWHTRRRKSSLTNHFRKKRMSVTEIAPGEIDDFS